MRAPLAAPQTVEPESSLVWRDGLRYLAGNAGALVWGFSFAYIALSLAGLGSGLQAMLKTSDFMEYYSAGRMIVDGHAAHMYNFAALSRTQVDVMLPFHPHYTLLPYLYPPYFALLLAPLAWLPYAVADFVWFAANCVMLVVSLFLLEQYIGLSRRSRIVFRVLVLAFVPVFITLALGQVSAFLLLCLTGVFFALRSGRDGLAGGCLAVALLKPGYVLPFVLVLIVWRRWRVLGAFALTGVVLVLAPLIVTGAAIYLPYLEDLRAVTSWQGRTGDITAGGALVAPTTYQAAWNHSLAGLAQMLTPGSSSGLLAAVLTAIVLLLLVVAAWRSQNPELMLALATVAALLVSTHTLVYDLALLVLPAAVAIRWRRATPVPAFAVVIVTYVAVTLGFPLAFALPVQISVVAMLVLYLWLTMLVPASRHWSAGNASP